MVRNLRAYRRQDSNLRDINVKGYEPSPIVHSGTTAIAMTRITLQHVSRLVLYAHHHL